MCLIRLLNKTKKKRRKQQQQRFETENDDLVSGLTLGSGLAHVIYLPLEVFLYMIAVIEYVLIAPALLCVLCGATFWLVSFFLNCSEFRKVKWLRPATKKN